MAECGLAHITPRRKLYLPATSADVPLHLFKAERVTDIRSGPPNPEQHRITNEWKTSQGDRELHYIWIGTLTFFIDDERMAQENEHEQTTPMESDREDEPGEPEGTDDGPTSGEGAPGTTSENPGSTSDSMPPPAATADPAPLPHEVPVPRTPMSLEPEPLEEPGVPASITESEFTIPPVQQQFFKPSKPETFAEHRGRVARQETLLLKRPEGYAPQREEPTRATPYSRPSENGEKIDFVLDVDFLSKTSLPAG